jgi:membrane-associated phospholipid phosphatase
MAITRLYRQGTQVIWTHRWRLLLVFLGVLVPLIGFGALAEDVWTTERIAWDLPILMFMYQHNSPWTTTLMIFVSEVGYAWGVVPIDLLIFGFLLLRRRWGDAIFWLLAVGGAGLLNIVAKLLFQRTRPDLWLSPSPESTFSFPSGHAMGSMALVSTLLVLLWPTRWRWPTLILGAIFVLLVSVSRVYLGVHYPSDILAGWCASLGWVLGISAVLYGRLVKPRSSSQPGDSPPESEPIG